ncbi:MAG: ester cyclase [Myxococcota bacterium]
MNTDNNEPTTLTASDESGTLSNRDVLRRVFEELWQARDMSAIERWHSADYANHTIPPEMGVPTDLNGMVVVLNMFFAAFSQTRLVAKEQVSEGDLISTHCMFYGRHTGEFRGVPASDREVEMRVIRIDRIRDGKICDHWSAPDFQGLMRQISG